MNSLLSLGLHFLYQYRPMDMDFILWIRIQHNHLFIFSLFQQVFIMSEAIVQDPRMGCTQVPLHLPGRWRTWRWRGGSLVFLGNVLLPGSHPRLTPRLWAEGLYMCRTAGTWRCHLVTAFSQGASPGSPASSSGLVLVGKRLSKEPPVVLDFGPDVHCHAADS